MTDQTTKIYPTFKAGDLATFHFHTDSRAGRIIEVKRNGKEIIFQEDLSKLDPGFKPLTIEGGFVGHCVNQNEQTYTYTPDPNGTTRVLTVRKWRDGHYCWTEKGGTPNGRNRISHGQKTFHDYNF